MRTLIASIIVLAVAAQANAAPRHVRSNFDYFGTHQGQSS
jgi:hypothetical protein